MCVCFSVSPTEKPWDEAIECDEGDEMDEVRELSGEQYV